MILMVSLSDAPDLLTTENLSELLRVDVQTVRRIIASGKLPGLKNGWRWYVPKSELEKFLEKQLEGVSA